MDSSSGTTCRSCRGRGRKSVRPRRLVVVRVSTDKEPVVRQVVCPFCKGTGKIPAAMAPAPGSGLAC